MPDLLYPLRRLLAVRVWVEGFSMEPPPGTLGLGHGSLALFDRLALLLRAPRRGDVVLLRLAGRWMVKRVLAVPGDRVEVREGWVRVNGEPVAVDPEEGPPRRWDLGPGRFFVLGDAPGLSTDSRRFGPVSRSALVGVLWRVRRAGRWVAP